MPLPASLTLSTAFLTGILLTLSLPSLTPYFSPYIPGLYQNWRWPTSERRRWETRGKGKGIQMIDDEDSSSISSSKKPYLEKEEETGGDDNGRKKEETEEEERRGGRTKGSGIENCIGHTPLFKIVSLSSETGCEIWGKGEFMNGCGGSVKDRVALKMIVTAEQQGLLTPHSGDMIYEGTVGSTGISLATVCRARGYTAYICMPSDVSLEKSSLLRTLGAIVERVPPAPIVDPMHFVNRARSLAAEHTADPTKPGRGYFADQFENEANWLAHFDGTGPEIYEQCEGKLDAFVAGAGTGGTIAGVARFLKPQMPELRVVLADSQGSGLYNRIKYGVMFDKREKEGTRRRQQVDSIVEGIGINRVTANFEAGRELVDDAIKVTDGQAMAMARWLVEHDGIFVGSSSCVNCVAAVKLARMLGPGHRIVTILCDSGSRYLSRFWAKAGDLAEQSYSDLETILNFNE